MNRFTKDQLAPHFEKWESVKETIEKLYAIGDKDSQKLMKLAIQDYTKLLEHGGRELNNRTGKSKYVLLPLNGEERFDFIKERIQSHYAYVQLDALYEETKKKAARLSVMKK